MKTYKQTKLGKTRFLSEDQIIKKLNVIAKSDIDLVDMLEKINEGSTLDNILLGRITREL